MSYHFLLRNRLCTAGRQEAGSRRQEWGKLLQTAFKRETVSPVTRRISAFILAAVMLCPLTSCSSTDPGELQFTVISDGTVAPQTEAEGSSSEAVTEKKYYSSETGKESEISSEKLVIPPHMETRYASLSFDERMQGAYNEVVSTMTEFREHSYIPLTISTSDYAKVLETVRCEQLAFFFLEDRTQGEFSSSAHTFEMNFTYKYSVHETNIMLRETEQEAMKIIAGTEGLSDYEKLKYFHDYLVLNVESSTDDPYADSVYGALVGHKALCEGFAKAFSYLCNIAGIENMIVTGYTDVDHMWNMVSLGGSWYHVDVGWDKPAASLAEKYPDMVLYQYFLASDDIIRNNRTINYMLGTPPTADSQEMNYFRHEGKYAESYDEALKIIEQSCARGIDSGEKYFMLRLDSSNLYLQTTANLIKPDETGTSDIDRIVSRLNFTGRISYIDYYKAHRIIIFVLD